jgi:hypothetical protein
LKIYRNLKLLSLFESFIRKPISNSLPLHEELLEKAIIKILFPSFLIQAYVNLLAKE